MTDMTKAEEVARAIAAFNDSLGHWFPEAALAAAIKAGMGVREVPAPTMDRALATFREMRKTRSTEETICACLEAALAEPGPSSPA